MMRSNREADVRNILLCAGVRKAWRACLACRACVACQVCLVCLACLALFCGCGREDGVILIGNVETQESGGKEGDQKNQGETCQEEMMIRVYVCGAVKNPGVVDVPEGSRAEDALSAAGGFAQDAAREAVNLADWVTDGQMLYFPTKEEAEELAAREASEAAGLVNINTADVAQLCTLPGIGESRAADIVAYREKNGSFESCEDIMKVPGIKTSAFEKICDKITVR